MNNEKQKNLMEKKVEQRLTKSNNNKIIEQQ